MPNRESVSPYITVMNDGVLRALLIKANGSENPVNSENSSKLNFFLVSIKSVRYVSSNFGVVVHPFMTL